MHPKSFKICFQVFGIEAYETKRTFEILLSNPKDKTSVSEKPEVNRAKSGKYKKTLRLSDFQLFIRLIKLRNKHKMQSSRFKNEEGWVWYEEN